jgi:hypothetical protein
MYLIELRRLAERCGFGNQKDELIRHKLLFGLDDDKVRDKLMREADEKLTLEYAIRAVKAAEVASLARPIEMLSREVGAAVNIKGQPSNTAMNIRSREGVKSQWKCLKCGREHAVNSALHMAHDAKDAEGEIIGLLHVRVVSVDELDILGRDTGKSQEEVYFGEVVQIDSVECGSWYANLRVSTRESVII